MKENPLLACTFHFSKTHEPVFKLYILCERAWHATQLATDPVGHKLKTIIVLKCMCQCRYPAIAERKALQYELEQALRQQRDSERECTELHAENAELAKANQELEKQVFSQNACA